MASFTYDVVVFDGTPGGVHAAINAAIGGAKTAIILVPAPGFTTAHPGGMIANGLGATDTGHYWTHTFGSSTLREMFWANTGYYGSSTTLYNFEPHVAERIFVEMLAKYGVDVFPNYFLSSATKSGTTITQITMTNADTFSATVFIDASYEGDLARAAGVTMVVGREARNYFSTTSPPSGTTWLSMVESVGGYNPSSLLSFNNFIDISPYVSGTSGPLVPFVNSDPLLSPGSADSQVMSYGYRLCLSQGSHNVEFPQPDGYDEDLIEIFIRGYDETSTFRPLGTVGGKFDLNWDYVPYADDPSGGPPAWATASYTDRAAICQQMYLQQASVLWWLQNSPDAPSQVREQLQDFGLPIDEFTDNTVTTKFWPRYPYVREAGRMVGQYVMTQTDIQNPTYAQTKTHPISLSTYSIDCHPCQFIVSGSGYLIDSNAQVPSMNRAVPIPYQVPFEAILPKAVECTNLMVLGAASFSHVAFCSYRIEHNWMMAGCAAGVIAALSTSGATPLNSLNYSSTIAPALSAAGIPLTYTP